MMRRFLICVFPSAVCGVVTSPNVHTQRSLAAAKSLNALFQESPTLAAKPGLARAVELLQSIGSAEVVGSNLTGAITAIVETLETDILGAILEHHSETQTTIDDSYTASKTATDLAKSKQSSTHDKMTSWITCTNQEKEDLVEFESKASDTANAEQTETNAGQAAENAKTISHTVVSKTLTCDALTDNNCNSSMTTFEHDFSTDTGSLLSSVGNDTTDYTSKNQTWTNAISDLAEKQTAENGAWTTFTGRVTECTGLLNKAKELKCDYKDKELDACAKLESYNGIVADVGASGTVLSESDRINEWQAVKKVICFLDSLKNNNTVAACDQTTFTYGDGAQGFAVLDTKEDTVSGNLECITTGIHFADLTINFWARTWTNHGPQDNPTAYSTEYVETSEHEKTLDKLKADCETV